MAESTKKLYYRRSGITYQIKTYTTTSDVGPEYLGLNIGGVTYYAKIGSVSDTFASHLRVHKGGVTKAVLTGVYSNERGYTIGGTDYAVSPYYSQTTCYSIPFATEVYATISATIGTGTRDAADVVDTTNVRLYALSGATNGSGAQTTTNAIQYLNMSSETTGTSSNVMPETRYGGCGLSGPNHGYAVGGHSPTNWSPTLSVVKFTYANQTPVNIGNLATVHMLHGEICSATAGYACGGFSSGQQVQSQVRKFTFSTDSAVTTNSMVTARRFPYSTNSTTYGYVACGGESATQTTLQSTEKMPFSTETWTVVHTNLAASGSTGNVSEATSGYHLASGTTFRVRKWHYPTDTVTIPQTGTLVWVPGADGQTGGLP